MFRPTGVTLFVCRTVLPPIIAVLYAPPWYLQYRNQINYSKLFYFILAGNKLFSFHRGYIGTWVHGYMGAWVRGYMGTWVHYVSITHGYRESCPAKPVYMNYYDFLYELFVYIIQLNLVSY